MSENNQEYLFSAEFDPKPFAKGADATIDKLAELTVTENGYKQSVKDLNKALIEKQAEIAKTNKFIIDNNINVKSLSGEVEKLASEEAALKDQLITQTAARIKQTESVKAYRAEIKASDDAVTGAATKSNVLTSALGRLTSGTSLGATAVNRFRREFVTDALVGFGAVIAAEVLPEILKLIDFSTEATKVQEILTGVYDSAAKTYGNNVGELTILQNKLLDLSVPEKDRIGYLKDYNDIADKGNKIDQTQIDNFDLIAQKIQEQIELIKKRALAKGAENVISEKAEELFKAQLDRQFVIDNNPEVDTDAILKKAQDKIAAFEKQRPDLPKITAEEALAVAALPKDTLDKMKVANVRLSDNAELLRELIPLATRYNKILDQTADGIDHSGQVATFEGEQLLTNANQNVKEKQDDLDRALKAIAPLIDPDSFKTKADKNVRVIENVYQQKVDELNARLAAINAAEFTNDDTLRAKVDAEIKKGDDEYDKLLKEKRLTQVQRDNLKVLLGVVEDAQLAKDISDFNDKRKKAQQEIDNIITGIIAEDGVKRVDAIKDQFQREKAEIEAQTDQTITTLNKKRQELISKINDDASKGLLVNGSLQDNQDKAKTNIDTLNNVFDKLIADIELDKVTKLGSVSFKAFEASLDEVKNAYNSLLGTIDTGAADKIRAAANKYLSGTENEKRYKQFQETQTQILKDAAKQREIVQLVEYQNALDLVNQKLSLDKTLNSDQIKKLEDQKDQLQALIDKLKLQLAAPTAPVESGLAKLIDNIKPYIDAIAQLTNAIVSFWKKANEAEQQQLTRSIALQEKRVSSAQQIADRGNASYLRAEQDRLNQLEVAQENSARRTIAINAVLQASQALVAFVSALAQGAKVGGALGAIIDAGALLALLASGYGIVKSLSNQAPHLKGGTKYLGRDNGESMGVDTIPAMLNEGEAVIPTDTNKQYSDTVGAIYDKKVPADVLNNFVNMYPNVKIPVVNHERIAQSAELKMTSDGRMVAVMAEQNQQLRSNNLLLKSVDSRLKNFQFNFNWDKKGVAASFLDAFKQSEINKHL